MAGHNSEFERAPSPRQDRAVRRWLLVVALLVLAMIVVGGATRLTDSGLSITEWQPIMGAIPPLSEADWQAAFEKYKQIPEYRIVNAGMSLEAFKHIFWWEWAHRFLGRLIGLAYGVPLLVLWLSGAIRREHGARLAGILALGAMQGAMGWYMVTSGLVDRVDVSHYRLAAHLAIAFVILGALVWQACELAPDDGLIRMRTLSATQHALAGVLVALVLLQVVLGALVAGLKAGLTYNTWPLMDGKLIPDGLGTLSPWYVNLFENVTTVQFNHRMTAYVVVLLAVVHALAVLRSADDERLIGSSATVALAAIAQAALGVWTLLMSVPIVLGVAHQGLAAILFALAVWHAHRMRRAAQDG